MGLARASAGSAADSAPKTRRITWRWEPKESGAARFAGPNRSTTAPTRLDALGYPPVPSNPARALASPASAARGPPALEPQMPIPCGVGREAAAVGRRQGAGAV